MVYFSKFNNLKGLINMSENKKLYLKVIAGELFEASITKKSFKEMGLGPGSEVCLNFKATSVEIL